MIKVQKRVTSGLKVLQYYTTRQWIFNSGKMKELSSKLSEDDQKEFYTNTNGIDWNRYMLNYVLGVREYCVGDGPETLPKAKQMMKRYAFFRNFSIVL